MPGPGRAGERGRGRETGKGRPRRRRARRAPHIPGELRFQQSGLGARSAGPARPGGRGGSGRGWTEPGGSGAVSGGGEGPAATALICKQKERHDPNKSGRAGGTRAPHRAPLRTAWFRDPRSPAPLRAPHRPAHLEDQPRHLTRYSSLPCGERREARVSGGGGAEGRGGCAGARSHLAEPLAEDALGGENLLSHAAQLLHGPGPGPAHAPAHSHTRGAPGRAPDGGRARSDPPRSTRAPRHNTAEGRGGVPKFPAGQWGAGGGAIRRGGWGEALSVCDPSSSSRAGAAAARPERGQWGGPARGFVSPGSAGASPAGPAGDPPGPTPPGVPAARSRAPSAPPGVRPGDKAPWGWGSQRRSPPERNGRQQRRHVLVLK